MMITAERFNRVLNHFNIAFTEQAVLGYLQRGQLDKAPRIDSGYYFRNTKYGYCSKTSDSSMPFELKAVFAKEENLKLSHWG